MLGCFALQHELAHLWKHAIVVRRIDRETVLIPKAWAEVGTCRRVIPALVTQIRPRAWSLLDTGVV